MSGRAVPKEERLMGGLYGALIGDALGVPYEFHAAEELPPYMEIEMTPPAGFRRAHAGVKPGTWSDDGAQALCLLDSLAACGKFDLNDFSARLLAWYQEGKWAVDGKVFDVGIQTGEALNAYRTGMPPEACGMLRPDGKGNGALMRVLPLALRHKGTYDELVRDAHKQCLITHGNRCNQVCCALYCLVARALLDGLDGAAGTQFTTVLHWSVRLLRLIYREMPEYEQELEWSIRPDEPWEGKGSGYVVDSLRSAFMIMEKAGSYEEAVKRAIRLGNDTDTTACITGGLAGIYFGYSDIPERWRLALRGTEEVEQLRTRAFS